jgi:protein-tyrosine-phosphatase
MRRLLFVCSANIVRSPSAELLALARVRGAARAVPPGGRGGHAGRGQWEIASAGVRALAGDGVDPDVAAALHRRGIDTRMHRAHQVDAAMLEAADLVLTFEAMHRSWIIDEVPSRRGTTLTVRRATQLLSQIPRRADPLGYLAGDNQAYGPADEFADPYGLGPDTAEAAVAEIEQLLAVILPALDAVPRGATAPRMS